MIEASVQHDRGEGTRYVMEEIRKCPECGTTSEEKVLVMPRRLPYEEAKAYRGEMYCLTHAPRFDGSDLDLVGRLV